MYIPSGALSYETCGLGRSTEMPYGPLHVTYKQIFSYISTCIGDLMLWANSQNIIKSNALLHKPQIFIGSLERYFRAESETSRTFEKNFLVNLCGK